MAQRGVSKVILIGTLGQDPEIRYIPNGGAVGRLSIATNESWREKQTGQQKEQTEWHKVVLFGKLAEIMNHGAKSKRANRKSKQSGIKSFCSENLLKLRVNIYEKVLRSTSKGNLKPVSGQMTPV